MKSAKPQTIDEYLAPLSADKRAALESLRTAIRAAAPGAEECISCGVPGFRLDGRLLVSFGAAARHCAGVTKQTISSHLAKLLDARLVSVVNQGRHRYFRLADERPRHGPADWR